MLTQLVAALLETLPAPSGHIYAALMGHGCTLDQYNQILAALTGEGLVQQHGQMLEATPKGKSFALLASEG